MSVFPVLLMMIAPSLKTKLNCRLSLFTVLGVEMEQICVLNCNEFHYLSQLTVGCC